ncbi:hypothetical protein [Yoonia litorea]|uniref:Response regulatory domain-containing protein n=1 Tax=Yoonia litorea TaxID=1123755 RepID=A0A1I6N027_9RHOB|nr:hypothetical protein [Yoonia litorea]SFS21315.1 hypothetical protein SAMN05444714_2797 [Yoonia litorea]
MNFTIIESDPVVLMDLESLLTEAFVDARITSGTSGADFVRLETFAFEDSVFIVRGSLITKDATLVALLEKASQHNCRIIVTGEPVALPRDVHFIDFPFSSEMMLDAITGDDSDPESSAAE